MIQLNVPCKKQAVELAIFIIFIFFLKSAIALPDDGILASHRICSKFFVAIAHHCFMVQHLITYIHLLHIPLFAQTLLGLSSSVVISESCKYLIAYRETCLDNVK
jgi:hypothetical protein